MNKHISGKSDKLLLFLLFSLLLTISGCVDSPPPTHISGDVVDSEYAKYHQTEDIVSTTPDTWNNISFNTIVDDESMENSFYFLDDTNTTLVANFSGLISIQGCLHPFNADANVQADAIYSRVIITGVESRCLQSSRTKTFKSKGVDTLNFIGTARISIGDKINLQWRTDNTKIILRGSPIFDDGVSATIHFLKTAN